jgi:hypothetical protein
MGSNLAEAIRFFSAQKILPWEGKLSRRSHVADLRHVKDPYNGVEITSVGKITGHFSPTVPPFAARISHVIVDMEVPGSESGNV